jgi:hypothetical protein
MSSAADALDVAHEQLRAALSRVGLGPRVGGYYPRTPLREPILDELLLDGEQALVITRNRYGAEVLNTDRLLIADVDLPETRERASGGLLRRLGVTVYRTASGLRVFVTGIEEPASSARGGQVLAKLGADPIYRELCRAHGTVRARLTPKPWRLPGLRAAAHRGAHQPPAGLTRLTHSVDCG